MKKKNRAEREALIARVRENNRKLLEVAQKAQTELDRRKESGQ